EDDSHEDAKTAELDDELPRRPRDLLIEYFLIGLAPGLGLTGVADLLVTHAPVASSRSTIARATTSPGLAQLPYWTLVQSATGDALGPIFCGLIRRLDRALHARLVEASAEG